MFRFESASNVKNRDLARWNATRLRGGGRKALFTRRNLRRIKNAAHLGTSKAGEAWKGFATTSAAVHLLYLESRITKRLGVKIIRDGNPAKGYCPCREKKSPSPGDGRHRCIPRARLYLEARLRLSLLIVGEVTIGPSSWRTKPHSGSTYP